MTYNAMSGKLVGLGQTTDIGNFQINNTTVSFLAAVPCDRFESVRVLSVPFVQLLAATFVGRPPPGVTQQALDAFTLRAMQCDLYSRPGNAEVDGWLREALPLPDCLDDDIIRLLGYAQEHGWKGPDPERNMLVWVMTRSQEGRYEYDLRRTPPCPKSCLNRYHTMLVSQCMLDPDSMCATTPALRAWFEQNVNKKLCPTFGRKMREAIDAAPCEEFGPYLGYCQQYGYDGPDARSNSMCWMLWTAGRLDSAIDRCGVATAQPAPPPPTTESPPAQAPEEIAPTPVQEEQVFAPEVEEMPVFEPSDPDVFFPPPPEPVPEDEGMSTATLGIIGILGLAAIGGVVMASRKRRRAS